jgi:chromosomal replication initiation ATPase DnaA
MDNVDGKRVMTQPEKVELILSRGCEYLGITREELSTKDARKSKIWYKKRFLIPILYENTSLTLKEVAELVGLQNHATILYHIRVMKEESSGELFGSKKTKQVYDELLSYLNL